MNKDVKRIVKAIENAALRLKVHPHDVKLGDLIDVVERDVRPFGGMKGIIKRHFQPPPKNHAVISDIKSTSAYVAKLEKQLGSRELFEAAVVEAIQEQIKPLPRIKLTNPKKQKSKIKRELVVSLNDTHYGLIVDPDEVNGLNKFGWQEACRRTAMVLRETIDFKPHTRAEVEKVHLVLNGDLIAGLIHGLNTKGIDLFVYQMNGAVHILAHFVSHLLANFKDVEVHGVVGNHSEAIHKREGGHRVTTEHFDSYANVLFFGLSTAFKDNPRVKFNFPKTPYAFIDLPAGRMMIAHGHSIFSKQLGNPGTSVNVKSLSDSIRKFNSGEIALGRKPVKLVLFGHTHTHCHFVTGDDLEVYVAPSLSGTDGYAHGLNINTNFVGQVVFESVKDIILADHRLVRVNKADKDSTLDTLIPTYKQELKWSK